MSHSHVTWDARMEYLSVYTLRPLTVWWAGTGPWGAALPGEGGTAGNSFDDRRGQGTMAHLISPLYWTLSNTRSIFNMKTKVTPYVLHIQYHYVIKYLCY